MPRTEEYYLSKGFDLPTAKYYANGRRKIVSVTPNGDFTLTLSFDNGERRLLDVKPIYRFRNPRSCWAAYQSAGKAHWSRYTSRQPHPMRRRCLLRFYQR